MGDPKLPLHRIAVKVEPTKRPSSTATAIAEAVDDLITAFVDWQLARDARLTMERAE